MAASISGSDRHRAVSHQPKRRIITPARQEQNKVAQRAYRKRQRELRKHDIALSGPARKLAPQPSSSSNSSPDPSSEDIMGDTDSISPVQQPAVGCSIETSSMLSADPVMNSIQTVQDTIRMAVLNNALCLGFDIDQLTTCGASYMSPFFRSITAQDSPRELFASTLQTSIPIHLQPTMAQILVPHHASLDLIPLPLLRERAIMFSFAEPHKFDLWDLKLDIYTRRGLVCRSHRIGGTCQPWDEKSWEAMPWFLKKWSMTSAE